MIKWTSRRGDVTLIGLGLEAGNVEKLMQGKPIFVRGADLGVPGVAIAIHYGATKQDMVDELREAGAVLPPESKWVR